jgi:HSP20 family protein
MKRAATNGHETKGDPMQPTNVTKNTTNPGAGADTTRSAPHDDPRSAAAPVGTVPAYKPAVDLCDDGADVRIVVDVPGTHADSIEVTFEDGILAVHAPVAARPLPGRMLRQEYGVGDYRRSFRLGDGFDASQITAELARGVLTVRVPRVAAVRPRRVEVRPG